jgi:ECF transporter S component (folate family)
MKKVRVISFSAMLLACATVLGFFKVPITEVIELRFAFLPIAAAGSLFGPIVGAVVGGLSDIFGYLVHPTGPFFPGFTISSAVQGMIFGLFLYKRPITWKRVIWANVVQTLVITMILNPIWLSVLYNMDFRIVFMSRLLKTVIMFPIETIMAYHVLKAVSAIYARQRIIYGS